MLDVAESACETGGEQPGCVATDADLRPSLVGTASCEAPEECFTWCLDDYVLQSQSGALDPTLPVYPLHRATMYALDGLREPVSLADEVGCGRVSYSSWDGPLLHYAFASEELVPWHVGPTRAVPGSAFRTGLILTQYWANVNGPAFAQGRGHPALDLSVAPWIVIVTCRDRDFDVSETVELCVGHGIDGATVTAVQGVSGEPIYNLSNTLPDPAQSTYTDNGVASFINVPPGPYRVRLEAPTGSTSMSCRPDPRTRTDGYVDGLDVQGFAWPGLNGSSVVFCAVE